MCAPSGPAGKHTTSPGPQLRLPVGRRSCRRRRRSRRATPRRRGGSGTGRRARPRRARRSCRRSGLRRSPRRPALAALRVAGAIRYRASVGVELAVDDVELRGIRSAAAPRRRLAASSGISEATSGIAASIRARRGTRATRSRPSSGGRARSGRSPARASGARPAARSPSSWSPGRRSRHGAAAGSQLEEERPRERHHRPAGDRDRDDESAGTTRATSRRGRRRGTRRRRRTTRSTITRASPNRSPRRLATMRREHVPEPDRAEDRRRDRHGLAETLGDVEDDERPRRRRTRPPTRRWRTGSAGSPAPRGRSASCASGTLPTRLEDASSALRAPRARGG